MSASSPPSISNLPPGHYRDVDLDVTTAMKSLVHPGSGNISCAECLAAAAGAEVRLSELKSVPEQVGHRLMALRYLLVNGEVWLKFFAWQKPLAKLAPDCVDAVPSVHEKLRLAASSVDEKGALAQRLVAGSLSDIGKALVDLDSPEALGLIAHVQAFDAHRVSLRNKLCVEGQELVFSEPGMIDQLFLLTEDLRRFPASTTPAGRLKYVIVADKGEMGTRAVRETIALGLIPVVLFSEQDDEGALQVRIAEESGGFSIGLRGNFRESYANAAQIAQKVLAFYDETFGVESSERLRESALYPGYGPLAENTAAIELFRRNGIAFIGPMQDVVERAGDKRKFRLIAQALDEKRVTPGIVMNESDPAKIIALIERGEQERRFVFPGRLKAANGGGGRGQVVIQSQAEVPAAVTKVLSEIRANGWDQGVMFEQNIAKTTHLEVQVLRDRFGNTRHFGMRDCTEQRASQKIQEEAPPALLRKNPKLEAEMCDIAVRIADSVGYVGACTVELMYKDGHFYLLEMNTRIQVEHPVTEEAHRIKKDGALVALNLVQLQMRIASGLPLDFEQSDIVCTHVAREFRINAESFKRDIKDPRDGKRGLFLPNAGVFDEIFVPEGDSIKDELAAAGVEGITDLVVRFDCGFDVGDVLLNKDPTFGKLIVAVGTDPNDGFQPFELLRQASLAVLSKMKISGRQVLPNGKVLEDRPFETNILDHIDVLETEMLKAHCTSGATGRHVNWLIDELRSRGA